MNTYKEIARACLSECLSETRHSLGCSQERMSEVLNISTRAYSDLEHGKYCVSGTTLLYLLGSLDDTAFHRLLKTFHDKVNCRDN